MSADTILWNATQRSSYGPLLEQQSMALTSAIYSSWKSGKVVIALARQTGQAVTPLVTATCKGQPGKGIDIYGDQYANGNTNNCSSFQGYDCEKTPPANQCCSITQKGSNATASRTTQKGNTGYGWNSQGWDDSENENGPCYGTPGAWKFGTATCPTCCLNSACTTADLSLAKLSLGGVVTPMTSGKTFNFLFESQVPANNGDGLQVVEASDGSYAVIAIPYERESIMASSQALWDYQNNFSTPAPATFPGYSQLDDYHRMMYDLAIQPMPLSASDYARVDPQKQTNGSMTTINPIFATGAVPDVLRQWYRAIPTTWQEEVAAAYCALNSGETDDSCRCFNAGVMTESNSEDFFYETLMSVSDGVNKSLLGDRNCWYAPCSGMSDVRFAWPPASLCPPIVNCNNIVISQDDSSISQSVINQSVTCKGVFSNNQGGGGAGDGGAAAAATTTENPILISIRAFFANPAGWIAANPLLAVAVGVGVLSLACLLTYLLMQMFK